MGESFSGWISIIGLLFLILWVTIPFAVFGIKPILRLLLKELRELDENKK